MKFITDAISPNKKEFLGLKNAIISKYKSIEWKNSLLGRFIGADDNNDERNIFRYEKFEIPGEKRDFNYFESEHILDL